MTMPELSCKTVAMQNSSQLPCSMCPIPKFRLVAVRTSYIYIFISWTLSSGPHYKPLFGSPLAAPCISVATPQTGTMCA